MVIASGGIGGNTTRSAGGGRHGLGKPPRRMVTGVPRRGRRMLDIAAGPGRPPGQRGTDDGTTPRVCRTGTRSGPVTGSGSCRAVLAVARREGSTGLPSPACRLRHPGHPDAAADDPGPRRPRHSWFLLDQSIVKKEFALSGSEQNPASRTGTCGSSCASRLGRSAPGPVEDFKEHGEDFVVADNLRDLVDGMNALTGDGLLDHDEIERQVRGPGRRGRRPVLGDAQAVGIRTSRRFPATALPDRPTAPPPGPRSRSAHRGAPVDRDAQDVWAASRPTSRPGTGSGRRPVSGLYAAGEAAGFGGARPRVQTRWGGVPRRLPLHRSHRGALARRRPVTPAATAPVGSTGVTVRGPAVVAGSTGDVPGRAGPSLWTTPEVGRRGPQAAAMPIPHPTLRRPVRTPRNSPRAGRSSPCSDAVLDDPPAPDQRTSDLWIQLFDATGHAHGVLVVVEGVEPAPDDELTGNSRRVLAHLLTLEVDGEGARRGRPGPASARDVVVDDLAWARRWDGLPRRRRAAPRRAPRQRRARPSTAVTAGARGPGSADGCRGGSGLLTRVGAADPPPAWTCR